MSDPKLFRVGNAIRIKSYPTDTDGRLELVGYIERFQGDRCYVVVTGVGSISSSCLQKVTDAQWPPAVEKSARFDSICGRVAKECEVTADKVRQIYDGVWRELDQYMA